MLLNDHWYQQDCAPAHSSKVMPDWLETSFPQRLISLKSSFPCPANSPYLNLLHFLSFGAWEARGFSHKSAEHRWNQGAYQKQRSCDTPGDAIGFNSGDPRSILGRDISRDILKNPGIFWFDFSLIKMCISLILPTNSHL